MMTSGRYDAKLDERGRIVLPDCFRKHWNSGKVFAATELSESGMYVACYQRQPSQEEYRNHRRARLERILAESHAPDVAHRTALIDITKDARFAKLAIDKHGSVLLRDLCRDAMIENPLLWVSTGMPAFNGNYCIELWNAADFGRAEAQLHQELGDALMRVYHVLPQD
jgi:DNA-binding transcriptional regulator/RsmH inhibitor MraZ